MRDRALKRDKRTIHPLTLAAILLLWGWAILTAGCGKVDLPVGPTPTTETFTPAPPDAECPTWKASVDAPSRGLTIYCPDFPPLPPTLPEEK